MREHKSMVGDCPRSCCPDTNADTDQHPDAHTHSDTNGDEHGDTHQDTNGDAHLRFHSVVLHMGLQFWLGAAMR